MHSFHKCKSSFSSLLCSNISAGSGLCRWSLFVSGCQTQTFAALVSHFKHSRHAQSSWFNSLSECESCSGVQSAGGLSSIIHRPFSVQPCLLKAKWGGAACLSSGPQKTGGVSYGEHSGPLKRFILKCLNCP